MTHMPDPRDHAPRTDGHAHGTSAGPGNGHGAGGWDGDTAIELLIANTGPGQTIVDFDDDPVLRAAAHTTGRRYRIPAPYAGVRPGGPHGADLVTLAWPRPDNPTPTAGQHALTTAAACLVAGGHVAVLLEPTVPQTYTVTWTGSLLAAARNAGLDYLQDIVCLHTSPHADDGPVRGVLAHPRTGTSPTTQHRVILVLRRQAGRHA